MAGRYSGRGSGEWEEPFWKQRGWIIAAGFLLAVLALAGVAMLSGGGGAESEAGGDPDPSPSSSPVDDPAEGKTGGEGDEGRPEGCKTDDSDQSLPKKSPKDMEWKANGTGLVPVSGSAGPKLYDGPVWHCFAHTPMGAVMAAHVITDQMAFAEWSQVVERQMVPGPERELFVQKRQKEKSLPRTGPKDEGGYVGFSVLSYTKEQATVMMLVDGRDGLYASTSVSLKWMDGDWKIVIHPDGGLYSGVSKVADTQGFVTWGE